MIMPAKWYTGGRGLDDFREDMLSDKHLSFLADIEDSRVCFPTADIAGGICYFLWDANHEGKCHFVNIKKDSQIQMKRDLNDSSVFIRSIQSISIIQKISDYGEPNMMSAVFSSNAFGVRSFVKGNEKPFPNSIKIYTSRGWEYVNKKDIVSNTDIIDKWKVMMSKTGAEHAGQADNSGKKRVISRIDILAPEEICSETYLVLSCYTNKSEASNHVLYMKTKFVRFLISTILLTQNIAKDKFQLVPLQDFTSHSDIDWTQSVSDIDRQLYKKYNLSDEEIAFIEQMIKPME